MKKAHFKYVLLTFIVFFLLVLIMISPLFEISAVEISGNKRLSQEIVKESMGVNGNMNILAFNPRRAKSNLLNNTYVKDVYIDKKIFKKTVKVNIDERRLCGYVEYDEGTYLYLDENGLVLEVKNNYTEKLPIVAGLDFSQFSVGQPLQVENEKSFENMVALSHLFNKHQIETSIIKVDLSDPENTRLLINNLDVSLGDIKDADKKIRTLKSMVEALDDDNVKGFIDIKDINKDPIFKWLT